VRLSMDLAGPTNRRISLDPNRNNLRQCLQVATTCKGYHAGQCNACIGLPAAMDFNHEAFHLARTIRVRL
jgi:hypothetical protein